MKSGYHGIKKTEFDNDTQEIAIKYSQQHEICTGIIGYRDIPDLIKKYSKGNVALDYGCGAGYSTELLHNLGYNVVGVDISDAMLEQAKLIYPHLAFKKATINSTTFTNNFFDLVLSTFVLFDIPTIENLYIYFKEVKRVLKQNGIFIACTGSEYFHLNNWLTEINDIKNNKNLKPGETFRVYLEKYDIYFNDVFYNHKNYMDAAKESGLKLEILHQPLGKKSDGINWTTEWTVPPYSIYVFSKSR